MTRPARPPEPIPVLSVAGLIVAVLGLAAWPLTGFWQAAPPSASPGAWSRC